MEKEIWKPVEGLEGFYEVSTLGRVRGILRHARTKNSSQRVVKERVLKPYPTTPRGGYLVVTLSYGNKRVRKTVHRLVAEAFIPNLNNLPQVNHIDGDKSNNRVSNLEWVSATENIRKVFTAGLYHIEKPVLCLETKRVFRSASEASRFYNISAASVA